jgi:hypothetical protein
MSLTELPNGHFVDLKTVQGVRPVIDERDGPRVLLDVSTNARTIMVNFDLLEAAREWARAIAAKVNSAQTAQGERIADMTEVLMLRAALLPFAQCALMQDAQNPSVSDSSAVWVSMGACRGAQRALSA